MYRAVPGDRGIHRTDGTAYALSALLHRDADAALVRDPVGDVVAGVDVADDAHAGVVRQDAGELLRREVGAVGERHLAGVQAAADVDAAPGVDRAPAPTRARVDERIEQRPVRDRVGAVGHRLGLAVGGRDRTGVEVVTADDDRLAHLSGADQLVEGQARRVPLAVAEPADSSR